MNETELDQVSINTIRFLSVDAVEKAQSGHPGAPLGAAPMAYVLWTRYLKHNPADPGWIDRDRFVLSAGARLAVEAGRSMGWERWVGSQGDILSVDCFGASAPGGVVMKEFGFSIASVVERALALLGRRGSDVT